MRQTSDDVYAGGISLPRVAPQQEKKYTQKPAFLGLPSRSKSHFFSQMKPLYEAFRLKDVEGLRRLLDTIDEVSVDSTDVLSDLGVMYRYIGELERAIRCYRRVFLYADHPIQIFGNLGNALKDVKRFAEASYMFRQGLARLPEDSQLWHNYGLCLSACVRHAEAVMAFRQAILLDKSTQKNKAVCWDLARSLFALGDYAEGGRYFYARWRLPGVSSRPIFPGRVWQGDAFHGQRLLLWPEQGFGDTIQCLRYIPLVCAYGGEVILAVRPELMELIQAQSWPANLRIVAEADVSQVTCDWNAPLMDLMAVFTRDVSQIPAAVGYLNVPPESEDLQDVMTALRALRQSSSARLHVGIVWSGSVSFGGNRERACDVDWFLQYLNMPGVQLYSLQKGPREADLLAHPDAASVIDLSPMLSSFADTAAVVKELDLVIMTDSSVAHLCGALGVPVWVLIAKNAHWLWLLDRNDSPWYHSMRFFRQVTHDDWRGVFDQVSASLLGRLQPVMLS